jgi:copper chaperone NosL
MDKRYGTEIVTSKGMVYTFDSVECLIEFLSENENSGMQASKMLVTSFTNPDRLIDANTAAYLISVEMPSPMGAYITAFGDIKVAEEFNLSKGGSLYKWEELLIYFRQIKR